MALTVQEAIARVPMWANPHEIEVSELEGGITNLNYRVDVDGKSFHLRIPGANTELLGINREHEYRSTLIAGELGIAPEVVYFVEPEGYLVTRFIDGRPIPPEELRQPENILKVAEILHNIHALPTIPGTFSAFQVVRDYTEIAKRYKVTFPESFKWLTSQMNIAEKALDSQRIFLKPCHNDLLNGNFLFTDRLYILDWEYAGMGDIFFDLANFSNNHELSEAQDEVLLNCYFARVTRQDMVHLKIMKIMSDFREAMWGLVQVGVSKLPFDFRAYANKHFDRLTQNVLNPNWEQWLKEFG
jgi:thiamine kinase-like enzyme